MSPSAWNKHKPHKNKGGYNVSFVLRGVHFETGPCKYLGQDTFSMRHVFADESQVYALTMKQIRFIKNEDDGR